MTISERHGIDVINDASSWFAFKQATTRKGGKDAGPTAVPGDGPPEAVSKFE
ncbi:MAG: hypothetical protein HY912_00960 [Desulfomonile tiedjei]|uniref:Uncharacterized protein n=1 Tax=Desulfomonile tiedjei TaxID=2358 RepID=A0A9D6Z1W8_9BACT|nr:hypothetical protein [Desulfomonile tiedjei]